MRILIADDEEMIRKGIRAIIERAGRTWNIVAEARDGIEVMEIIRHEIVDALIVDIRMPGMDGIEVAHEVKKCFPNIIIIIISGYAEFSFSQKLFGTNTIGYILKPTKPNELIGLLDKAEKMLIMASRKREKEKELIEENNNLRVKLGVNKAGIGDDYMDDSNLDDEIETNSTKEQKKIIKLAIQFIDSNFNLDISLKDISQKFYLNSNYFCTLFKQQTGYNFTDYIEKKRIDKAKEIIIGRMDLKLYEIARMVGYFDSKYFSQVFKKSVGVTPAEYREKEGLKEK